MGQDGANRYAYVYNHPTTLIDPSGFDGVYYDASAAYGGYSSSNYGGGYYYPNPNMCAGTAGYYVPPTVTSPSMTYAGGQSYAGETGNWGGAGPYSPDAYSASMSGKYGATGTATASLPVAGYSIPLSWYENDLIWQYAQSGSVGLGLGALIAATYGAAAAAGPTVYAYLTGTSATVATSPELVGTGAAAAKYAIDNAPKIEAAAPRAGAVAAGRANLQTGIQRYWPMNNGFQGVVNNLELQVGTLLDRYGLGTGTFAAPAGTPFEMRSLPVEALRSPYYVYKVLQPFDVNSGLTAPAFGRLGQGIQYQLPMSVNELVSQGYLQVIGSW